MFETVYLILTMSHSHHMTYDYLIYRFSNTCAIINTWCFDKQMSLPYVINHLSLTLPLTRCLNLKFGSQNQKSAVERKANMISQSCVWGEAKICKPISVGHIRFQDSKKKKKKRLTAQKVMFFVKIVEMTSLTTDLEHITFPPPGNHLFLATNMFPLLSCLSNPNF